MPEADPTTPDAGQAGDGAPREALAKRIEEIVTEIFRRGEIALPDRPATPLRQNISESQGQMLRDLVAAQGPNQRTLEIGMASGLSTLYMCWGLLQATDNGRHTAIDPFQMGEEYGGRGLALIEHAQCRDMVDWVCEMDDQALPKLAADGARFNVVFIDGSHLFEYAFLDFFYVDQLLPVGGLVAFDDADWPSVLRVIHFALRHRDYEWAADIPVEFGPWSRPWALRNRWNRYRRCRTYGWTVRDSLRRRPCRMIVLKKVGQRQNTSRFWSSLE